MLQLMLRHDTVNANLSKRANPEAPLIDELEQLARAWNFTTERLPVQPAGENLLVRFAPTPDHPWLLFDAHLDTVGIEHMTIDPFAGHIQDNRVLGRGACDTKGSAAAMLWALRQYALNPPHPQNITLLFSIDEEFGMTGIQSFLNHSLPSLDFQPAGIIVGEPTELHPVVAHNGVLRWTLSAHGIAAHSSVPHQGCSAISLMARAIAGIEDQYIASLDAEHFLTGQAACSINVIHGGSAPNIIPDRCDVLIDRRVLPGEALDRDALRAQVRSIAERAVADLQRDTPQTPPSPAFTDALLIDHPPLSDARNADLLARAKASLGALDLPRLHTGAPFGTHAGFCDEAGLPALVLGPGDPQRAHHAAEWIDLSQLHLGAKLYEQLMRTV